MSLRDNTNFDTDDIKDEELATLVDIVDTVHIVGYDNMYNEGDKDGAKATNHWAMFLEIASDKSIRLDMYPGYGSDGQRGKVQVLYKEYNVTNTAIHNVTFPVVKAHTTAQTIVDVITSNGRERYKFVDDEGCRYWVWTLICDLEAEGIIARGSSTTAQNAVSYYWDNEGNYSLREVTKGTFY